MKGILGRKLGMTQVFTESGKLIPVTAIYVEKNVVTQVKTEEIDGYNAVQLGTVDKKEKNATKASIGHAKKAGTTPKRFLKELRGHTELNLGDEIYADTFAKGDYVDVTGTSKGKGYSGVIKRHNQQRGPMGHGSQYHRSVGSMGTLRAMRVLKGKKMPGQMGNETVTVQNLVVIDVDMENNVILVKGNVPGPKKSLVFIKKAVKKGEENQSVEDLISYLNNEETSNVEETKVEEAAEEAKEEATAETTEEVKEDKESKA